MYTIIIANIYENEIALFFKLQSSSNHTKFYTRTKTVNKFYPFPLHAYSTTKYIPVVLFFW